MKKCSLQNVSFLVHFILVKTSECSSGVERNLAKVDVARSNRVTRSSPWTGQDYSKNPSLNGWVKGLACKNL